MEREHFLAAEIYGYSYDHYQEKIEMGHIRFTKIMPEDARLVEIADKENWSDEKLAEKLEVNLDKIEYYKKALNYAKRIVDAENSMKSYIESIKVSVETAVDSGIEDEHDINNLVSQILFRTADFGFLLKDEGNELWQYSKKLRDYT